jgi:drug/metabolite transporter (DMT)-like permease
MTKLTPTKLALAFAAAMVLVSGTYSAVVTKIMYKMDVDGIACGTPSSEGPRLFQKPYIFTVFMFVGEALCLFYKWAEDWWNGRKNDDGSFPPAAGPDSSRKNIKSARAPLLDPTAPNSSNGANGAHANGNGAGAGNGSSADDLSTSSPPEYAAVISSDTDPSQEIAEPVLRKPPVWYFACLCLFDLSATTIGGIGLIWVTASANQMLRGSMILFTGFFAILIFRKNLKKFQWIGIGIVCIGLVLVGAAGMLRSEHGGDSDNSDATPSQVVVGLLLVLAGSALNSLQNVLEEKIMKGMAADPLEVVGWEGVFGTIFSAFIMLPIVQAIPGSDCGSVENTTDTLRMMHNSPLLTILMLGFSIGLAFMNNYSQVLSKYMSAVIRMMINTCRVVLVWLIDLLIYYAIPKGQGYGESLDIYSTLQLAGFILLMVGTAVYIKASQPPAKVVDAIDQENVGSTGSVTKDRPSTQDEV